MSECEKIRNFILRIDKPFNQTDLFYHMKHLHNIGNHKFICEVLDELCESEVIRYVEIEKDCWGFVKIKI